jgi:Carboxypeptidase regulatory-like domain
MVMGSGASPPRAAVVSSRIAIWLGAVAFTSSALALFAVSPALASFSSIAGVVTNTEGQPLERGAISGLVTSATGQPIAKATVTVLDDGSSVASSQTEADGTYTVGSLPAGDYTVKFAVAAPVAGFSPGGGNYLPQYYEEKGSSQDADSVSVQEGATTTGIDARLLTGGVIKGQALDQSGTPVHGMEVTVYGAGAEAIQSTYTDSEGHYTIDQLQSGSYALGAAEPPQHSPPNDLPVFYPARGTLAGASAVVVTAGSESEIDMRVRSGGRITGAVSEPSGPGIEHAGVQLLEAGGQQVAEVSTGSDGEYEIDGLESGSYYVRFLPPPTNPLFSSFDGNFLESYFNGEGSLASAEPVTVTIGATTADVDATLPAGGELTGKVTAAGGEALKNVDVTAYNAEGNQVGSTLSASDGTYTLGGLKTGVYRVRFAAELGGLYTSPGDYAPQFNGGAGSLEDATAVAVTVGEPASVVSAQMQPGAQISGTVTGPTGEAVTGESVLAYGENGVAEGSARTGSDGSYTIANLRGGSYRVGFAEGSRGTDELDLVEQFFPSAPSLETAQPVNVPAGETVSGIDTQLATGGTITGSVTLASGALQVGEIMVEIYDQAGQGVATGLVEPDGDYSVGALAGGAYKVRFIFLESQSEPPQFFGGTSLAGATGVSVSAGATTPNVDMQLTRAPGAITGTVSNPAGDGIGAQVSAYDSNGIAVANVTAAPDGSYAFSGLVPGFYRLEFTASGYPSEFYGGAGSLVDADAILVPSGTTAEQIDQQISAPGAPTSVAPTPAMVPGAIPALSLLPTDSDGVSAAPAVVVPAVKKLTRAEKRAKALAACKRLKKRKRAKCDAAAKRRYPLRAPKPSANSRHPKR